MRRFDEGRNEDETESHALSIDPSVSGSDSARARASAGSTAPMPLPKGAVFLSYAREDAEPARRIADTLRVFGVEVWFDQNELRGGDVWDAKIRQQIKDCALFVPLISAQAQQRGEGYFRLEWKLAAERTHLMADRVPFLLPVAIDRTPESRATVPAEFLRVQWTRLGDGLPSAEFVAHVKHLLAARHQPGGAGGQEALDDPRQPAPGRTDRRRLRWPWIAGAAVAAALALTALQVSGLFTARGSMPARATAAVLADRSIAVLPFANMSDDKDANAFFADGIHEDILTNLALIRELRVVSRTSVMGYRNTTKKIGEVAGELGVAYILEGSVRRAGNKVRVTGQLIRAENDEHLWAKSYDRDLTDVFSIQAALAQEIAGALKTALSPQEKSLVARQPTQNAAAYELYLRARTAEGMNRANWDRRKLLYQTAVELDPNFAEAWARLGGMFAIGFYMGWDTSAAPREKGRLAVARALALASEVPEVMRDVAQFHLFNLDYDQALQQATQLVQLQPKLWSGYTTLSNIQRRQGKWAETLVNASKGVQLDPGNSYAVRILARDLQYCRRFAEAEREQTRVVSLLPENLHEKAVLAHLRFLSNGSSDGWQTLLASFEQKETPYLLALRKEWAARTGDFNEARRLDHVQPYFDEAGTPHSEQALAAAAVCLAQADQAAARARLGSLAEQLRGRLGSEPDNPWIWRDLGQMEAVLRRADEAVRCAQKAVDLRPVAKDSYAGPGFRYGLAVVYAWNGDKARAVAELAEILRVPSVANVHELRSGPWFVSLRGDPAFEALLNDPKNNQPLF